MTKTMPSRAARVKQVEAVLSTVLENGRVVAADGSSHEIVPISIPRMEGDALRRWVEREDAVHTIEVGLAYGVSALFICAGLLANGSAEARHVALDPNQHSGFADAALELLRKANVSELVEFYTAPSEIALPRFLAEHRSFDLAFVDGNHRFEHVFLDVVYLGRLVRGGGVLFLDDWQYPATKKVAAFCIRNLGWGIEEEGVADEVHHWVVLRTPRTPVERRFDYFVDF